MTNFVKVSVVLNEVTFEYTSLFGKRKCKSIRYSNCCPMSCTANRIVEKGDEAVEIDKLKETILNFCKSYLYATYRNVEIINAEYVVNLTDVNKLPAEWCLKHLTIEQLVKIGMTIVNGEDL